jgi:dolichol-phosphate mannosyltransferase
MKEKADLSFVIPVYNEEHVIEKFLTALFESLNDIDLSFEIIFIDDGSKDNTIQIINKFRSKYSSIKSISFTRNFGHQCALWAGIENSSGSAVIMMDSDLQHPPSLIPDLIREWQAGAKVVQTIRKDLNISFFKKMTSKLFYFFLNLISNLKLNPSTADFRLVDREVVNKLLEFQEHDIFLRGLIPWLGFPTSYLEFNVEPRVYGKSKYSFKKMLTLATSGITSFTTFPLKIAVILGAIISLGSFFMGMRAIYTRLLTDRALPGWASVMVGTFFIGGVLMLFLGILGEYLGKIYLEVKQRPKYIIKERSGFEDKE